MHFFLNIEPHTVTQQMHRVGKRKDGTIYFYEDRSLREARTLLRHELSRIQKETIHEGPVRLVVKWLFPRGKHPDGAYKTSKPDTDNLNKMLKDEMTKMGFWADDAQVASEIIEKFWAEQPGIFIAVDSLERKDDYGFY